MGSYPLSYLIDVKEKDFIYLIKNNEIEKDKKYVIHSLEIKEDGNWHDGFIYSHYAFLEEINTQLLSYEVIAVTSKMLQINDIYFASC